VADDLDDVQGDDKLARGTLELVEDVKADFVERDKMITECTKALFYENEIYLPPAYRDMGTAIGVHSPLPTINTNTVVSALSVNSPKVRFTPVGSGDNATENQALRQRFFEGAWERQQEEAARNIFAPFVHAVVCKGCGILKTTERRKRAWGGTDGYYAKSKARRKELDGDKRLDDDGRKRVWDRDTEGYKRAAPYPIASIDVPPETFYYVKNEDGLSLAIEDKLVPYYDTLTRYGAALSKAGKVIGAKEYTALPATEWSSVFGSGTLNDRHLRMLEVWDAEWVTYLLQGPEDRAGSSKGGMVVRRFKHGYGDKQRGVLRGPYFMALGTTTSDRAHGREGLPILFGYLDLFKVLDSFLSIRVNAGYMTGTPSFKSPKEEYGGGKSPFGEDAVDQAGKKTEKFELGKIYEGDIQPIDMPRTGFDFNAAIEGVVALIERMVPPVMQGAVSDDSGYAINQAAHLASLSWSPIVRNMEFALSQRVGFESWLLEKKVGETVYVHGELPFTGPNRPINRKGWIAMSPEDLGGVHHYSVELEPEKPKNRILDTRMHRELRELGAESERQMVEELGNNPAEVRFERKVEEIQNSPEYKAMYLERVMKELGLRAAAQAQEAGIGPPQAPPQPQPPTGMPQPVLAGPPGAMPPPGMQPPPPNGQGGIPPRPQAVQGGQPGTPVQPGPPPGSMPLPGQ